MTLTVPLLCCCDLATPRASPFPQGNAWQRLWAAAAPLPAAQQRPLLDPRLEGERALHFLETLPPAALWSELLAVGYSAAVQLLCTLGPAAELAPVRRQLECLVAVAGPELQQGVAAVLEDGTPPVPPHPERRPSSPEASGSGGSEDGSVSEEEGGGSTRAAAAQRQPSWLRSVFSGGLSSGAFRRLLLLLGCAEQTAVASHSLLLRLVPPGSSASASGRLSSRPSEFALAAASGLIAAALGEQQQQQQAAAADAEQLPAAAPAAAVDLARAHWPEAEALLVHQQEWEEEEEEESEGSGGSGRAGSSSSAPWPEPFLRWAWQGWQCSKGGAAAACLRTQCRWGTPPSHALLLCPFRTPSRREWLWQVSLAETRAEASSSQGGGLQPAGPDSPQRGRAASRLLAHAEAPTQRLYVRALPAEVRCATALSCER